ncbi:MAG: NAD(P)/FAD-dependent oxidoreductase, partial [Gemmatimonadota bacterium]|nr:NAD(P)/FAD-dependent oxidoreductase [Gemmatimonadota bacterium]
DVIVVGGGPAGSSTAFFLAQAGANVLVLDRARFPRDKPCSEYMSPEASRILSEMGALDPIELSGAEKLAGMTVTSQAGTTIRGDFAAVRDFRPFRDYGLALRRTVLDEILLRRAESVGARVLEGSKVTDVLKTASGVVRGVRVDDSVSGARELRSRLVIGADGLRSVVGRRLGLIKSGWPRRIALVAHYKGVEGMKDAGEIHLDTRGYSGMANVGGGVTNVAVVVPASRSAELARDRTAFFEEWFASRPKLGERFAHAERVTPVRATGPFASAAKVAWAPGAALVGDAADFFDPITGEGIYAALRGGEILAGHVLSDLSQTGSGACSGLIAYESARRREFDGKWRIEKLLGVGVAAPAVMNRIARVLARNKDMMNLLIGVAGDFVPASAVLNPRFFLKLAFGRGVQA